ncbi:MAG TPA: SDR family NAD(P)-dependent oxidoreductase [Terriglobales bacterium]|nr:SDR family NAD(P)-dependent oxidoreductase [Terriglobales bacterium]
MKQGGILQQQVSVVTGGGRGIGAAIASKLADFGADVVICGRSLQTLKETADRIRGAGGKCEAVECDVTDMHSVEKLAGWVEKKFGRVDILVNNAGVGGFGGPLHSLPPDVWDGILNTNLRGAYYCIRGFAPAMIRARRGDIVNISSIAGKNALPNGAAYAASKWGLNGLSYSVAEELRGYNIRVSVVCPGSVQTELSPHTGRDTSKMLQPEDVAHAVAMIVTEPQRAFASEVILRPTQKP